MPTRTRALVVSIDMDAPREYARLHDLALGDHDPLLMYRAPLERFAALCADLGATGTVFAVGRDVEAGADVALAPLVRRGFEVASHSYSHDYALSRLPAARAHDDVARSVAIIEARVGVRPRGFRAPGYHLSAAVLDALERAGLVYDSSVFPCPAYYAAKALVLAAYRLRARRSAAILSSPRLLLAPTRPYRPARDPYRRGHRGLWELPVSVAGAAKLPTTGAALLLAPEALRAGIVSALERQEIVVLNLHAMDLVDAVRDGLPRAVAERQPELRQSVTQRLDVLRTLLQRLASGRDGLTCAQLAERLTESAAA